MQRLCARGATAHCGTACCSDFRQINMESEKGVSVDDCPVKGRGRGGGGRYVGLLVSLGEGTPLGELPKLSSGLCGLGFTAYLQPPIVKDRLRTEVAVS